MAAPSVLGRRVATPSVYHRRACQIAQAPRRWQQAVTAPPRACPVTAAPARAPPFAVAPSRAFPIAAGPRRGSLDGPAPPSSPSSCRRGGSEARRFFCATNAVATCAQRGRYSGLVARSRHAPSTPPSRWNPGGVQAPPRTLRRPWRRCVGRFSPSSTPPLRAIYHVLP